MLAYSGHIGRLAFAAAALFVSALATAQNAEDVKVLYQGRLQNMAGAALTGSVVMEFRVFEHPVNGTPEDALWGEIHVSVKVDSTGGFTAILGDGDTLGLRNENNELTTLGSVLDGRSLYLEMAVNINEEPKALKPRHPILYAPYAAFAIRAEHADQASDVVDPPAEPEVVPPGTIVAYAGPISNPNTGVPEGWILCDGRTLDSARDQNGEQSDIFKPLFDVIGRRWGAPNAALETEFNVPDLRGVFLRGVKGGRAFENDDRQNWGEFADDAREVLANAEGNTNEVGSFQGQLYKEHRHFFGPYTNVFRTDGLDTHNGTDDSAPNVLGEPAINNAIRMTEGNYRGVRSGTLSASETRPANITVHYLIKY